MMDGPHDFSEASLMFLAAEKQNHIDNYFLESSELTSETRDVVWLLFIGVPAGMIHILLNTEIHRRINVIGGKIGV
jgi:hypothetical protein